MSSAAAAARELPEARPSLAVDLCGLTLASPVVLLSGCVGFGEEYTRVEGFSNRDAGAVCLKGTTLEPRLGNPPHRVHETPCGMLNSIGLQNPGSRSVIDRILPGLDFGETRFFANIAGATLDEYEELARRFDDSPVDAIEINISCPNVEEGGLIFGNDPIMSAPGRRGLPPGDAKAPLHQALAEPDRRRGERAPVHRGGDRRPRGGQHLRGDGDRRGDRPSRHRRGAGRALGARDQAARPPPRVPGEPGCRPPRGSDHRPGGIASTEDAIEFLLAGASAVGIGTALFYDPLICRTVNEGLAEWLVRRGAGGIAETAQSMRAAAAHP